MASCTNPTAIPEPAKTQHFFLPSYLYDDEINNGADFTCQLADNERFKEEVIRTVNAIRKQAILCGDVLMSTSPELKWNQKLLYSAYTNSKELAGSNIISHTSVDGKQLGDKFRLSPYEFSIALENIAAGQNSLATVIQDWKTSPGHCKNLMDERVTEIAVSCTYKKSSFYKYYWTMHLGAPIAPKLIEEKQVPTPKDQSARDVLDRLIR